MLLKLHPSRKPQQLVGDVILSPAAPPKKRKAVEKIARAKVPANAAEAPRRSNRQNDEQKTRAEVARVAALLYNPEDSDDSDF